jgi:hypothetical protein
LIALIINIHPLKDLGRDLQKELNTKFSKDTIEKTSFASNMPGNVRSGDVHLVN